MIKIEFLYFEGCPNSKPALNNLKNIIEEEGIQADLKIINVQSNKQVEEIGFQGSPSIRINGQDLEEKKEGFAFSCRIYEINGEKTGVPSKNFIRNKMHSILS